MPSKPPIDVPRQYHDCEAAGCGLLATDYVAGYRLDGTMAHGYFLCARHGAWQYAEDHGRLAAVYCARRSGGWTY